VNFDEYCRQKAAPPGSSSYYALREAPYARQGVLTALFALRRELEETVQEIHDPAVGQTKLAWWQKELAALAAGQASHPVTRALAAHHPRLAEESAALQALAEGFRIDLEQARYLDFTNLRRYAAATGGIFAGLVARAAAPAPGVSSPWAEPLGEALTLVQCLNEIGRYARQGRIYVPIDDLQRFEVTAADLMHARYSPAYRDLMKFQAQRARDALRQACAAVPAAERRTQRTLLALTALALALLDEIEADGFEVLHQQISLTPLRKLWLAWRAGRR
jgi:15-cis-phytoene synthase